MEDTIKRDRKQLIRLVWERGPISRAELADEMQCSRSRISTLTSELIEKNVIAEVGSYNLRNNAMPTNGRHVALLDFAEMGVYAGGISVGEGYVNAGLATMDGHRLGVESCKITECNPELVARKGRELLESILKKCCLPYDKIRSIGVGILSSVYEQMQAKIGRVQVDFSETKRIMAEILEKPLYIGSMHSEIVLCHGGKHIQEKPDERVGTVFLSDRSLYAMNRAEVLFFGCNTLAGEEVYHLIRPDGTIAGNQATLHSFREAMEKATGKNLRNVEVNEIVSMAEQNVRLQPLLNTFIDELSCFLCNFKIMRRLDRLVVTCETGPFPKVWDLVQNRITAFCGKEFAENVQLAKMQGEHLVLAACCYGAYEIW